MVKEAAAAAAAAIPARRYTALDQQRDGLDFRLGRLRVKGCKKEKVRLSPLGVRRKRKKRN